MMTDRVVVTGMGVVAPTGVGTKAFDAALRDGLSGARAVTSFDCTGFPTRIAAEVDDSTFDPSGYVKPLKMIKLMSRAARFAVGATAMARHQAGLGEDAVDPFRLGTSLGVGGMGPVDIEMLRDQAQAVLVAAEEKASYEYDVPSFAHAYLEGTNPLSALRGLPNLAAAHVAIQQNARGPNNTIATACTSGTQAIGVGMRMIESGDADVVLAGGTDAMINPVGLVGFSMLGTLSERNDSPTRACRPFELERDGFVMGEGAAILVLERESFARARGASILANVIGYGATCDAFRITDERPDASSSVIAMRNAIHDADLAPSDIQYLNAHGTGTRMNDILETRAVKEVFNGHAYSLPISSTKSMIGHLLAAAGAAEAIATILAMCGDYLPPTINLDRPDPECDLDYVPVKSREAAFEVALSNSFGFGGQNACLVIQKI
jgi:3-oxoacyl-[acyl-carrier-protein] synthase II